MEHESFEDDEVASWMNQFYINIKVDREERPDIDSVYMNAAQLTTGRGGWPLNIIALPNGDPVFAGTYFPKQNWIRVLEHFVNNWKKKPEELKEMAGKIKDGLQSMDMSQLITNHDSAYELVKDNIHVIANNILTQIDMTKGGLQQAPKFPMPCVFDFLQDYYFLTENNQTKKALDITLTSMFNGGIYDHIGGGFARYSTDEDWLVPHFEKMLYDNGQLLSIYSRAYGMTQNSIYLQTIEETINWLETEMLDPSGLFYSSLDADSEGVEGKFYCWTYQEITEALEENTSLFCDYYSVTQTGNWEGTNILHRSNSIKDLCDKYEISETQLNQLIKEGKESLAAIREKRIRPGLDDKCLTSWNALTIIGLCQAHQFQSDSKCLTLAENCVRFILKNMKQPSGLLFRNFKNGKTSIPGFLDDQAIMIKALIELYKSTWKEEYLNEATILTDKVIEHFFDEATSTFFYTSYDQEQPVMKNREMTDNVIPSSNAIMAEVLFQLGLYFDHQGYLDTSKGLVQHIKDKAKKFGPYYSHWGKVLLGQLQRFEIAITGNIDNEVLQKLRLIPGSILMKKNGDSDLPLLGDKPASEKLAIYLCKDRTCDLPVDNEQEVLNQVRMGWEVN